MSYLKAPPLVIDDTIDVAVNFARANKISLTYAADGQAEQEFDLFGKQDGDGNASLWIRRTDESGNTVEEPYFSRFKLHIHDFSPPPDDMGRSNDIYLDTSSGKWWQRREGVWGLVGTVPRAVDGINGARGSFFWPIYATTAVLPTTANGVAVGDMAYVESTGKIYRFGGTTWQIVAKIKGEDGSSPTIAIGDVTTLAAGATATATFGGTALARILNIGIPAGQPGPSGVVTANAPLTYDAATKTIGIPAATSTTPGHMTAPHADALAKLAALKPLSLLNQKFTVPVISLGLGTPPSKTYTVTGARAGMGVKITPRDVSNLSALITGFVSADDTVTAFIPTTIAVTLAVDKYIDIQVSPNAS